MFEVSSKVDYALLILLALAESNNYMSLADIAKHHQISPKYLSQVVMPLKQAKLVKSREGSKGGYALALTPRQISLRRVIEAIDGPLHLTRCMDPEQHCPATAACTTRPVWSQLKQSIYQLLEQRSLADVMTTS